MVTIRQISGKPPLANLPTCQLAKIKCKMILVSISIQKLAILVSSYVWVRYNDLLLPSLSNKINSPK